MSESAIVGGDAPGKFIIGVYDDYSTNRCDADEWRWQIVNDHMKAIDTDQWKDGEAGRSADGTDTSENMLDDSWRSQDFERVTKTKVYAAFGNIIETIMPDGDIPFGLDDDPDAGTTPPPITPEDKKSGIKAGYELMEKKLRRQLKDGKADRAVLRVLLSMVEYGEGNLKGPILKTRKKIFWDKIPKSPEELGLPPGVDPAQAGLAPDDMVKFDRREVEEQTPTFEYLSVWDVFKDHEVDDQQLGRGIIHRTFVTPEELKLKLGEAFYDDEALDEVIQRNSK